MEVGFAATYFDGKSSKAYPVQVLYDGRKLRIQGTGIDLQPAMEACEVVPPVGSAARLFRLPGGGRLETSDLAAVATLEQHLGLNRGLSWVQRVERRWQSVVLAIVGIALFVGAFIRFGIPEIAQWAALVTPAGVLAPISQQTLKLLDDRFFEPSKLSAAQRTRLEADFHKVTHAIGGNYAYKLELRSSPSMGANALALPSGTVVVTDELVKLAQNDREIIGVMAHEVGHVIQRHSLRGVYQSVSVVLVVSLLLGDVTSPTSIAASMPTLLIQSGYSRNFERQADAVAGHYMIAQGWGTEPLQNILDRLTKSSGGSGKASMLSSHPGTEERIKNLKALEGN